MILPFKGRNRITQRYKGNTHKGIDVVGDDDRTIHSVCAGTVQNIAWDPYPDGGMGYYVRVQKTSNGHFFYYAHCLANSAKVKIGQKVAIGTALATMGNTGHSNGAHLHLEERRTRSSSTYVDITKTLGIENKYPATYTNGGGSAADQEDDMTEADVKKIVESVLKSTYGVSTSATIPQYAKESFEEVVDAGVMANTEPNKIVNRAMLATVAARLLDETYQNIDEVPADYKPAIQAYIDAGALKGDQKGRLQLDEDMARTLTVVYRLFGNKEA